jgi:phosphatidylglycerol---prolipoprotein diacylglyceryl transferase
MYPVWFKLAWIDVPSFTALMALALGAGLALTWSAARRAGLPTADVLDVALVAVLVGVIGARAGYVTVNWEYYRSHTNEIARVWQGGLVWHSGWAGGVIGAAIASAWRKFDLRAVLNALTPGLMAGAALGWIGCYLSGAAYGREVFPGDRWWFLAADLPDMYGLRNPRFATQLLGAAWATICFILALITQADERRRTTDESGPASFVMGPPSFAIAVTLYSAGTFVLGFTRGDAAPLLGGWRLDQVMDAGIAVLGVVYILSSIVSRTIKARTRPSRP